MFRLTRALALLAGAVCVGSGALAQPAKLTSLLASKELGPGPRPTGRPLATILADKFASIHATIKPTDKESKGMDEIAWFGTLDAARRKAAAEGKPIFLFATSLHPLGQS
jgi:hypothetical protein